MSCYFIPYTNVSKWFSIVKSYKYKSFITFDVNNLVIPGIIKSYLESFFMKDICFTCSKDFIIDYRLIIIDYGLVPVYSDQWEFDLFKQTNLVPRKPPTENSKEN